jgi:hypothetical protein
VRTGKVTRVNRNDEELATLRERHPGWQIWRVDRYLGGPLWCARPLGQTQPVLNAARPGRLSELIEAEEAGLTATGPAPERDRRAAAGQAGRAMSLPSDRARRFRIARRADTVPPSWLCPAGPAPCSLPVLPRAG